MTRHWTPVFAAAFTLALAGTPAMAQDSATDQQGQSGSAAGQDNQTTPNGTVPDQNRMGPGMTRQDPETMGQGMAGQGMMGQGTMGQGTMGQGMMGQGMMRGPGQGMYNQQGPGMRGSGQGMYGPQGPGQGMMGPGQGRGMMGPDQGQGMMMGPGQGRGMMGPGQGQGMMMGPGQGMMRPGMMHHKMMRGRGQGGPTLKVETPDGLTFTCHAGMQACLQALEQVRSGTDGGGQEP